MLASVVLAGALWVAGDAAYKHFGCCDVGADCCSEPSACCLVSAKQPTSDCCSTAKPVSECCAVKTSASAPQPCCDAAFTYCTRTDTIYEGCCCEVVNGQYRCLITGIVSDECCCIPLND
jgi:hypothetical protein